VKLITIFPQVLLFLGRHWETMVRCLYSRFPIFINSQNINTSSVKNQILLFAILIGFTSCSTLRRGNPDSAAASTQKQSTASQSSPAFIENISIKPGNQQSSVKTTTTAGKSTTSSYPALANESGDAAVTGVEVNASVMFKYAILLDVPVEEITNFRLIEFIESWYGTRYRYGGNDKSGVDCSGFSKEFISFLFSFTVPRTSSEQYKTSKRIKKSELQEGDLVFFYTRGRRNGVSHVGIYLRNNKFVHASTSNGVVINDLDDEYYARNFAGAGRVK
jgi:cell wall-associated NlpC family hydrolase